MLRLGRQGGQLPEGYGLWRILRWLMVAVVGYMALLVLVPQRPTFSFVYMLVVIGALIAFFVRVQRRRRQEA